MEEGPLSVRIANFEEERDVLLYVRKAAFNADHDMPEDYLLDGDDPHCRHIIAFHDGKPAGCGRARLVEEGVKLEKLAVLPELRKKGVALLIMKYAMQESFKVCVDVGMKIPCVILHAIEGRQSIYESTWIVSTHLMTSSFQLTVDSL
eukprot:TRINITY_DN13782_c0_g1_i4.p1 TRINITY_DN13782_c0_g1~~TRINITY_DN13782_c0_g1_i4.p1  ORF type:complete len:148 (+),score=38.02 TRINITY_DN13782_c0_g1_i4:69-512(+)